MASVVKTTAVALRRGNTEANKIFTGVEGELVVDLGADGTGTDIDTTLRLHNGITQGGIPMARADLANITTRVLASGRTVLNDKNLAYADLSNLETLENPTNIVNILSGYGLVKNSQLETDLEAYAKADFTNIDTAKLATSAGHKGKDLAYADTSNINTKDLVDTIKHPGGTSGNKALAYADMSNVDLSHITGQFAAADLSNVSTDSWEAIKLQQNLESKTLKDYAILEDNIEVEHYPTTQAVVDYVKQGGIGTNKLNTDFSNALNWDILYSDDPTHFEYLGDGQIINGGTGFEITKDYYTGLTLDADKETLAVEVTSLNIHDNIASAKIRPEFGKTDLSSSNQLTIINEKGGEALIQFTSTKQSNGLYKYEVSSITNIKEGGFEEIEYNNQNSITAVPALFIKPLTVNEAGTITSYKFKPSDGGTDITGELTISSDKSGSTPAKINAVCRNTFPQVGGAGLLKNNLTNLPGMSNADTLAEKDSDWRIRSNIAIPKVASAQDYHRIVTAGLVSDAIKDATGELTGYAKLTGNNTFTGTNTFKTQNASDNSTKAATTAFVQAALTAMLDAMWPVDSIFIGTQSTCPMQTLIPGSSWVSIEGRYLLSSGTLAGTSESYTAKSVVNPGLPNIKGTFGGISLAGTGAFTSTGNIACDTSTSVGGGRNYDFDASRSSSTYGSSTTVRAPAYVVNVWRRTA